VKVVFEDLKSIRGEGQEALLAALTQDMKASFREQEIFQPELQDLARAQAVLQHESDHGEIAESAKAFPEAGDLLSGEGHDHAARLSQSQIGRNLGLPAAVAERRARGIPALKERFAGNFLCVMEAIQAAQHAQAVIDGLRRG
jgi:hypothetical protein